MLLFSCASHPEARPFIRLLHLKRELDVHRFELFRSDKAALIVTGAGCMEAAAAVGFFLTHIEGPEDLFVHVRAVDVRADDRRADDGRADDVGTDAAKADTAGTDAVRSHAAAGPALLALCSRVLSPDGRVFYPDLLFSHPFEETTEDSPEAAGAFRAASLFLPLQRILVVRMAASPGGAEEQAAALCRWLAPLAQGLREPAPVFSPEETALLRDVAGRLRLTEALRLELERLARFRKLRGDSLAELLGSGAEDGAPGGGQSRGVRSCGSPADGVLIDDGLIDGGPADDSPACGGPTDGGPACYSLQERKKAFARLRDKLLEF